MIIRPTPWFMAAAGGAAMAEITVGLGTGEFEGSAGFCGSAFAGNFGMTPFGSISDPDLMHAIVWSIEDPSELASVYSKTNTKIFTFPDFVSSYFDTKEFANAASMAPPLAPIYATEATYYMGGGSLPVTAGAKVRYIVTNSP